jgi:low affinity Fe/Cu permease
VAGGALVFVMLAGALVAWLVRGRSERPLRARDVFRMPANVDGFIVVQLLRSLGSSPLVQLTDTQRAEMRQEIERIQQSCFANGSALTEGELQAVARKWLKIAC